MKAFRFYARPPKSKKAIITRHLCFAIPGSGFQETYSDWNDHQNDIKVKHDKLKVADTNDIIKELASLKHGVDKLDTNLTENSDGKSKGI